MLHALEKFVSYQESNVYRVEYLHLNAASFVPSIKKQVEKYIKELNDYHKQLVHSEYIALGLEFDMSIDWEWYKKHAHIYALFHGDVIVGICTCGTYATGRKAKNVCYIMELIVDKKYRGKGLGTFLVNETVEDCKRNEPYISRVMIDVYDANTTSMQSYLKQGFKSFRHTLYKSC